jgi:DNA-binding MarR family transcriptional regulator
MRDPVTHLLLFRGMATQRTRTPTDPPSEIASGLVRLMLSMEALYTRESRKAGLTSQQAQLLCTAARRQASLGEIAEVLRCDRSNVSRLLDRLGPRGLAYRGSADRDGRVAVIRLTDEGQEVVKRFEENLEARLNDLVAEWPATKRKVAADSLLSLVHAIHGDMAAEDAATEDLATDQLAAAAR